MDTIRKELRSNWRFHLGECENAWYKGYDDSSFRNVTIPHDWSVELPFSQEYSSGTGYLAGGTGWYRIDFSLPEAYRGKQIRLIFDGVYKNSQVWCNSYYLGKRPNGYTAFSYDISEFAVFGDAENNISVKVSHTDLTDSRWFTGSGITRKVTLLIEEPVHPAEYGIFFQALHVEEMSAQLQVTHQIENHSEACVDLLVETVFYDAAGTATLKLKGNQRLAPGETGKLLLSGAMESPVLWSVDNPYRYVMKTWYQPEGQERYLVNQEFAGIRSILFHPDKGFFLNGSGMKLQGVCVHHDGGVLGAAMYAPVWQRRLSLLKKCGCNAIRCSHNPHMPQLYELCDAMGFLVMDEAFDEWENAKNKWWQGHNVYPPKHQGYYEDFPQWHEADLRTMVRRDRNHPCIILWSIGNEIDYPNDPYCHPLFQEMTGNNDADKPEKELKFDPHKPNAKRLSVLAAHLAAIVRQEDRSRPVTLAAAFPELSARLGFLDPLDVAGYNYKEQFYEEDHVKFPEKSLLGSENSHSYQAFRAVTDHPYISGQFLWTGIDYLGEAKGWPVHGSPAGLLTTAGFPKPEYYRRSTFWQGNTELFLASCPADDPHLLRCCWNYNPGQKVLVFCYANLSRFPENFSVILEQNQQETGRLKKYNTDGAFVFETVFAPGLLQVCCCDENGTVLAGHSLKTTGKASRLAIDLWKEPDAVTGLDFDTVSHTDGYIYQLLLTLTDESGNPVVWDDRIVKVQIQGAGELKGLDNGNLSDVTPFCSHTRKTWNGNLAVYIQRTGPGRILAALECEGIMPEDKTLSGGSFCQVVLD